MPAVIIEDYTPEWPALFEAERARIMEKIGDYVTDIQHGGSTSVPGLAAKPVIDIYVGVRHLADIDAHGIQPMRDLGYEYIAKFEDVMPFRRYFRRLTADGIHTHHVHIWPVDHPEWARHIDFRDYLRQHPTDRDAYAALKREVALEATDRHDYNDRKTAFIQEIEAKARAWRQSGDG